MPMNPSLEYSLPELRAAEARLRALAQQVGISYRLADFGGMRTQADTTNILNYRLADYRAAVKRNPAIAKIPINTWRPIAPFGRSLHNWGAAFDVIITGVPQGWSGDKALQALGALAPQAGLRWGGTFPRATLDPPHFELPMSVVDARAAYLAATNGKGYQGPKSPFSIFTSFFGIGAPQQAPARTAPAPQQQYVPAISYIQPRVENIFDSMPGPVASSLPPIQAPVQATEDESEGKVVGRISSSATGAPSYMLADVPAIPVRTDATDAAHLAAAQDAKRQRDMKMYGTIIVVGLLVASLRPNRRGR